MKVNLFFSKWCYDDYDADSEQFYIKNVFYLINRDFAKTSLKYGLIILLVFAGINWIFDGEGGLFSPLECSMLLAISIYMGFLVYSFDAYSYNGQLAIIKGAIISVFVGVTLAKTNGLLVSIVFIPVLIAWIATTIYLPIKFFFNFQTFKKEMDQELDKEEAKERAQYNSWKTAYQRDDDAAIPQKESENRQKARSLFDGYINDKNDLKIRFRQLAKLYHPDHGGDEHLFKEILNVYHEYQDQL